MKKFWLLMLALACVAPAATLAGHHEGEQEGEHKEMAGDMAEMEAWVAANQPGSEHEVLQRMVGEWTYTTSGPMGESEGTMHAESIFDGRYVLHHWKGSFMGQDFEGHGVDGYDTMQGKYVSGWIDNFSTGVMTSHGECANEDCTEMVSWSKAMGPNGEMQKSKSHFAWNGDDSFTMTMYMVPEEGDPVEQMTLVGTRVEGEAHADMEAAEAEMEAAEGEMEAAEAEMEAAEAEMEAAEAEAEEAMEEAEEAMEEASEVIEEAAAAGEDE